MTNDLLKKGANLEQKVIIVADDLTGASDTGVQFVKAGLKASVLFKPSFDDISRYKEEDVLIVDTDSRSMPSEKAYNEVSQVVQPFLQEHSHLFFKKVDSTLRGNIGIELQALMDLGRFDAAVIAPAYPDAKRSTAYGIHYVEGVPVHLSEAAKDPKTPVLTSSISDLIAEQTNVRPKNLTQQAVHSALTDTSHEVASLLKHGHQWFVCDAETNNDLTQIVELFMKMDQRVLWVGSAGLASALSAYVAKQRSSIRPKKEPVLIVSGSASQKTNEQFAYLRDQHDCLEVKVNPLNVLNGCEAWERKSVMDQLLMRQDEDILLYTDARPEIVEQMLAYGKAKGMTRQEVGSTLSVCLGMITKDIVELTGVKRLFLTGGDTARAICHKLGAGGIQLLKEIEPGIPLGRLVDTHLYAVTKAGAYGQKDSVLHAVEVLKNIEGEDECQNQSLL